MAWDFNPFVGNLDKVLGLSDVDRLTSISSVAGATLVFTSDGTINTLTSSLADLTIAAGSSGINIREVSSVVNYVELLNTFPVLTTPVSQNILYIGPANELMLSLSSSTDQVLLTTGHTYAISGTPKITIANNAITWSSGAANSQQLITPSQSLGISEGTSGSLYPVFQIDYNNVGGSRNIFSVTQNAGSITFLQIAQNGINVLEWAGTAGISIKSRGASTGADHFVFQTNNALTTGTLFRLKSNTETIQSVVANSGGNFEFFWDSSGTGSAVDVYKMQSNSVDKFVINTDGYTKLLDNDIRLGGNLAANVALLFDSLAANGTITWNDTTTLFNFSDTATFPAGQGIDATSAGSLVIGPTTATSILIGASAIPTTISSAVLNIGPDSTANPTVNFLGSTNDGSFRWQEGSNYFWISDDIRLGDYSTGIGRLGIGTTPITTAGTNSSHFYVDVTGYGGDYQAHNRQTSTGTTYTAVGVRTQANIGTGVTTRGSATGGQFSARLNGWLGGSTVVSSEILGGRFASDTSGSCINFTYPQFTAGRFILQIGPSTDAGIVTTGYCAELSYSIPATNSVFTNLRFINIAASSAFGAGSSVTNFDAIYIADQTNVSVTEANPRLLTVESQNGTSSGANKFNFVWEGGDWDTSHIQMGAAHWWVTSGATRFKTSVPSSATDYALQISATVLAPGTNGGLTLGENGLGFGTAYFKDTSAAFEDLLVFTSSTALTADRTWTLDCVNASRTIKVQGNPTLDDWFDQNVKVAGTPRFARLGLGAAADGTRVLTVSDAAAAPTLAGVPPTFTDYYGGNTNALGDPTEWIYVQTAAGTRKIPAYA